LFEIATSEARGPDLLGRGLQVRVDRRLDPQAALERELGALLAAAELVDDLLLDPGGEVRVLRVLFREGQVVARGQRLGLLGLIERLRQVPLLRHPKKDEVAPALGGDRMQGGVERARRRDDRGQQRGLMRQQDRGAARLVLPAPAVVVVEGEVRLRRRLDPVGAVAEVDRVEVVAEDPLLGPLAREVVGERGLAQLLEDGAVVLGGERDLHELLRDRRRALDRAAGRDVLQGRSADAAEIDPAVGVEAVVLDRDDRVLHDRSDLTLGQVDPALVAGQRADLATAGVDDHRRLVGRLLERRQVRRDGHEHPEQRGDDGQDAEEEEDRQHPQLADLEALLALAPAPQTRQSKPPALTRARELEHLGALGRSLGGNGACALVIAHVQLSTDASLRQRLRQG
jgi:hypothetical protein